MLRIAAATAILLHGLVASAAETLPAPDADTTSETAPAPVADVEPDAAAAVALPEEQTQRSVAVFDITAKVGIEQASADVFGELLQARLRNELGFRVVGRSDIESMLGLEAMKQAVNCDDSQCLAQIGGALGVDEMVTGSLAKLGGTLVISLKRVDPNAATVLGQATHQLKNANDDAMVDAVNPLVEDLYPEASSQVATAAGSSGEVADSVSFAIGFSAGGAFLVDEDGDSSLDVPIGAWVEPHPLVNLEVFYLVDNRDLLASVRGWLLQWKFLRAGPTVDLAAYQKWDGDSPDGRGFGIGVGGAADIGTQFDWLRIGLRLDVKAFYYLQDELFVVPVILSANMGVAI